MKHQTFSQGHGVNFDAIDAIELGLTHVVLVLLLNFYDQFVTALVPLVNLTLVNQNLFRSVLE